MNIAIYNFDIYQGNDDVYILKIEEIKENDVSSNFNLTDYQFVLTIKDNAISDSISTLSTDNGNIKLGVFDDNNTFIESDDTPYLIKIYFPHSLTEKLYAPKYKYDLFGFKPDGSREVFLRGDINVTRSILYGKNSLRHY